MTDPTLGRDPDGPRPRNGELPSPYDTPGASSPYATPDRPPRRSRTVALAVGVAAMLGAGVFAAVALTGGDGSASPAEAVERLFAAVADEDIIGVLESLPPGERSAIRPGLEDMAEELRRLGLISDDLDLGGVDGVDFEVEGLTVSSEELGEGVAAVTITGGTITSSTSPDELPIGPALGDMLDGPDGDPGLEPETTTDELASDEAVIVAIEEDGGWHVSLAYSVAEIARQGSGLDVPAFGEGVEPEGAESPEAVVGGVLDAIIALDARRLVAFNPPDEMRALHDYAPLFLGQVEEAAEELRGEAPYEINIDQLDLEPEVDGDVAQVLLTGFEASGTLPGDLPFTASYDGDCFSYDASGTVEEFCLSEMQAPDTPFSRDFVLTTVRRDGEWYLSPTRTVFEQLLRSLRALEPEDIENFESLFGPFFGLGMGMGMGFSESIEVAPGAPAPTPDDPGPGAASLPGDECLAPLEELPFDASDEDFERANEEVQRCIEELPGS